MKNKIGKIFLTLAFLIPISVKAEGFTTSLSCPSSAALSENVTCSISTSQSGIVISELLANYSFINSTYVSFSQFENITMDSSNDLGFSVSNSSGFNSNQKIGDLVVKMPDQMPEEGKSIITLSNIEGYDSSLDMAFIAVNASATISLKSSNNKLSSLNVSGTKFNFNPLTESYNLTVNSDKATISAVKEDSNASVSGDIGIVNLNYGTNTFKIEVISEAGSKRTYKLNIIRPDNRSNNAYLKELKISGVSFSFDKNITTYNLNVDNDINSITIKAEVEDSKSKFVSGFGPRIVELKNGNNEILVQVQNEKGDIRTYYINVDKKEKKSNDASLKNIIISNGKINFKADTYIYEVNVEYDVKTFEIKTEANSSKAKVQIEGNKELKVGKNKYIITVEAEDKTKKIYTVNVLRNEKGYKLSSNSKIKTLTISNYDFKFDNNIRDYYLTVKNDEKSLDFDIVLADSKSDYVIEGNEKLADGSVINIIVNAEDGTQTKYIINISKEAKSGLSFKIIILSVLSLLVFLTIIYIFIIKPNVGKRREIFKLQDSKTTSEINNEEIVNINSQAVPNTVNVETNTISDFEEIETIDSIDEDFIEDF